MKKIIAIVLLLALVACSLVACKKTEDAPETPAVSEYKLAVVVDNGLAAESGNPTLVALALVWDADGKIVAARFDSAQPKYALNEDKTDIVAIDRVTTKVELGDNYNMPAGTWESQAKAFENFIVGKTAAQVAALDTSNVGPENPIVAGCSMSSTTPTFQALVAKAFAYERAVSFSTSETVTLGLAIDCALSGSVANGGKIAGDVAGVAVAGGKVVASMIDSFEAKHTLTIGEDQKLSIALSEYKGTKNEQGDAYNMVTYGGAIAEWYTQAQTYANTTVGKTVAELANLAVEGVAGCTIGVDSYKAALVRAAGYVR